MSEERITWEGQAETQFQTILKQIPDMIRGIAETRIKKKTHNNVKEYNRLVITEKYIVDSFFAETPAAFMDAMKNSMKDLGVDYAQYGHQ